ncbi:MAG: undecaprenyl/decaprenyl-phosphate alpha-N-acetylglucosaminyl 1-phosphate transferase [Candidatus Omnitrophica bacterium]|nr:undecaprenyl/decaprenyl-phosphate alpha-N-acetylglucosaminyl 1-phosphate transferase [Candidatus Omnitrophota bacterium]
MLVSLIVGMLTSVGCAVGLRLWARRCHVTGKVGEPLLKQDRDLPPIGGIALALGFLMGAVTLTVQGGLRWTGQWWSMVGAGAVLLIVGLIDDFARELSPWQKLVGQSAAWLLLLRGNITTHIVLLPPWANLAISLVWTLAIVNAFNLLDIADGLAAGIGLIATGTFLILSLLAGQPALAGLLAGLCGALAGILMFNFPRATLFLGDSGSMLLGLLLAAFALAISYAPLGREVALLTPIVVLGLPIYDLAFVTIVRVRQGRSPLVKSGDHFVFRLIQQGRSPTKAVLAIFGFCLAFSLAACVISRTSNLLGLLTLGVVVVMSLWWGVRLARVRIP